jgi:glycosyltransferase involved in cell wall biosynthesis
MRALLLRVVEPDTGDGLTQSSSLRRVVAVSHAREIGGAERWLAEVLRRGEEPLRGRLGARFELVCRLDASLDEWAAEVAAGGVRVHRLDLARPDHVWRLGGLVRGAALVHLNLSFAAGRYQALAALTARATGAPLVVFHHVPVEPERLPGRAWVWFARRLGRLASTHAAVSRPGADTLVTRYGYPVSGVEVFPALLDADRFRAADPGGRDAARRELGIDEGARVVLTVGRLSAQKGLLDLVDVAEATADSDPCWRFVVIGEGEMRAELQAGIADRRLGARVALLGRQAPAALPRWMAAADVLVQPSHFEGLPATVLEALACGCPVVATAVGGVPDLAIPAELGRVVPPRRPAELAAAIRDVLSEVRPPVPEDACERLLAPYRADRVVGSVLDLYRRVIDR